jgi:hypothetical protein
MNTPRPALSEFPEKGTFKQQKTFVKKLLPVDRPILATALKTIESKNFDVQPAELPAGMSAKVYLHSVSDSSNETNKDDGNAADEKDGVCIPAVVQREVVIEDGKKNQSLTLNVPTDDGNCAASYQVAFFSDGTVKSVKRRSIPMAELSADLANDGTSNAGVVAQVCMDPTDVVMFQAYQPQTLTRR